MHDDAHYRVVSLLLVGYWEWETVVKWEMVIHKTENV